MKKIFFLLCLFAINLTDAQQTTFDNLAVGLKQGNEKIVLAQVVDKLLLNIDQKEAVYSKSQAEMILKNFFKKNPPLRFEYIFVGKKSNVNCAVGILSCKEKEYRISITLKEVVPVYKLEQLTIEQK